MGEAEVVGGDEEALEDVAVVEVVAVVVVVVAAILEGLAVEEMATEGDLNRGDVVVDVGEGVGGEVEVEGEVGAVVSRAWERREARRLL